MLCCQAFCQGLISNGDSLIIHIDHGGCNDALRLRMCNDSVRAEYVIFKENSDSLRLQGKLVDFYKENFNDREILKEWTMTDDHRAFVNRILSELRALKAEQNRLFL
jgi:hypothetical protein